MRDQNNLSRAETPLYKGISSDDVRDGGVFRYSFDIFQSPGFCIQTVTDIPVRFLKARLKVL